MAPAETVKSYLDRAHWTIRAQSTSIAVLLACVLLLPTASTPAAGRHGAASHAAVAPSRSFRFSVPPQTTHARSTWRRPWHELAGPKLHLRQRGVRAQPSKGQTKGQTKDQTFGKHARRERHPAAISPMRA